MCFVLFCCLDTVVAHNRVIAKNSNSNGVFSLYEEKGVSSTAGNGTVTVGPNMPNVPNMGKLMNTVENVMDALQSGSGLPGMMSNSGPFGMFGMPVPLIFAV